MCVLPTVGQGQSAYIERGQKATLERVSTLISSCLSWGSNSDPQGLGSKSLYP